MLVGHSMTEILMRHVMFYLLGSERPSRREYAVLRELQPKSVLVNYHGHKARGFKPESPSR